MVQDLGTEGGVGLHLALESAHLKERRHRNITLCLSWTASKVASNIREKQQERERKLRKIYVASGVGQCRQPWQTLLPSGQLAGVSSPLTWKEEPC